MRTVSEHQTRGVITAHNAAAKVIWDTNVSASGQDVFQDVRWKYHIDDLKDPFAYRKVRRTQLRDSGRVKLVWDFQQNKAVVKSPKDPDDNRGYTHTLKTPLSLLPPTGKMGLYAESALVLTGLIYDITACDLRGEKYLFSGDGRTSAGWWKDRAPAGTDPSRSPGPLLPSPARSLKDRVEEAQTNYGKVGSLAKLRELSNAVTSGGKGVFYNETLAGVSKAAIVGILWSPRDGTPAGALLARLTARSRQWYLAQALQVKAPIFRIAIDGEPELYTAQLAGQDEAEVLDQTEVGRQAVAALGKGLGCPVEAALELVQKRLVEWKTL